MGFVKNYTSTKNHGKTCYGKMADYQRSEKFLKLFTRNRPEAMRLLEETNCSVKYFYLDGRTPVHYAAQDGDHISLNKLIERGAEIWQMCDGDFYPLHLAVMDKRIKIVKILLSGDIPDHVIENINETSTDEGNVPKPCIFYSALETFDENVLKELVNKFFPLIEGNVITYVVRQIIERMNAEEIKFILEESKEGMRELGHLDSLKCSIETEWPDDDKTTFILEVGKYGYPLDMALYHKSLKSYIEDCPDCYILKLLIRNKRKVVHMNTPMLLFYALKYSNLYAIDILFSIGSDPKNMSDLEDYDSSVIRKLVLHGGCELISTTSTTSVVNEIRRQVSLFDLLSYRILYLSDLKRKLRSDSTRKRSRNSI